MRPAVIDKTELIVSTAAKKVSENKISAYGSAAAGAKAGNAGETEKRFLTKETVRTVFRGHVPEPIGKFRYFSVLVPFVEKDGRLFLMYEVRAEDLPTQPGEVCFPGGHTEPGETAMECALRETEEETGIHADEIELVGEGNTLYGSSGFTLRTFIGILPFDAYEKAEIEKSEVGEIFLVSVDELANMVPDVYSQNMRAVTDEDFPYEKVGIGRDYPWRTAKTGILVYDVDGRVIWGLTAKVTNDVLVLLGLTEGKDPDGEKR